MSTVLQEIASLFRRWDGCRKFSTSPEIVNVEDRLEDLVKARMPSGSGFDGGTRFQFMESKVDRLVFATAFHHMNETGFYDGWTDHTVIVTPAFGGFSLRITGRDRNQIKDYIYDVFHHALNQKTTIGDLVKEIAA